MSNLQVNQTDSSVFLRLLNHKFEALAESGGSLGLLIVHLENFDRLISAFGYPTGNKLIAAFAEQLIASVRQTDKVIRISESKFAIVISPLRNQGMAVLAATKLGKVCSRPILIGQAEMTTDIRMGIATGPEQGENPENLLQNAETALLAAFSDNSTFATYEHDQREQTSESLRLDSELGTAIQQNEFQLFYQPKLAARSFSPCGAEALIRWNNKRRGFVSPEIFIPLADRSGRVEPLTAFVLNSALKQASQWPQHLSVSVNVSAKMVQNSELVDMVGLALKLWDFEPSRLVIEITEGALMDNPELSFHVLSQLRELGAKISIDDFGTGYSSFAYFKNIPADELKIDKSFVLNMFDDDGDKKIVRAIIQLSKEFGLDVTAEGVEDERTARILSEFGCDRLQGFHYSAPIPAKQFNDWIRDFAPQIPLKA